MPEQQHTFGPACTCPPVGRRWQKATYCGSNACVEVARTDYGVMVRDSKEPDGDPLAFTAESWTAFLAGVKAGDFDV